MIVFFFPDLRGGGAERVMLTLLKAFHEDFEQDVALLLGKKTGNLVNQIPKGVQVYELNAGSAMESVIPFIKFCKEYQPQKVFASLGSSLTTALAKPFISKKIEIINRLGNTIGAEKKLFKSSLKAFFYIKANQLIAKNSDKVIFQCQYMADDYLHETGVTPKSYKVIYNPVHSEKAQELSQNRVDVDYDFVAIGRLAPQKDYQTLIEAFHILKNQHHSAIKVRILGDGEQREQLQKLIEKWGLEDRVKISGFIDNPYPFIRNAKALISSSLYEGFSNVIVESLCIGTPVVASNCPGANNEVLRMGKDGFLFETGNPIALATAILENFSKFDDVNRTEISAVATSRFDVKKISQQYKSYIV